MLDVMDVMADAYTQYRTKQTSGYVWNDESFELNWEFLTNTADVETAVLMGLPSVFEFFPPLPLAPSPPTKLEGWWLGNSGEVLAFKRDHFRIYIDPDHYREGQFQVIDWQMAMTDPDSRTVRQYDFALQRNYLALRDEEGDTLYYVHVEP